MKKFNHSLLLSSLIIVVVTLATQCITTVTAQGGIANLLDNNTEVPEVVPTTKTGTSESTTAETKYFGACAGKRKKCNKLMFDPIPGSDGDVEKKLHVRCCSEQRFDFSQSKKCPTIFGGSRGIDRQCSGKVNSDDAESFCAAVGARLCTCEEILDQCAKGTGCGLNSKLVWCTST